MLPALTLLAAVASGQVPVYRSVGSHPGPLAVGDAGLNVVAGSLASFGSPLPDNVGVGDVIQYDSDANGTPDALAFIIQRGTPASFYVQNESGGPAANVFGAVGWQVFRAYATLGAAVNTNPAFGPLGGAANASIAPSLKGFDAFSGGKDLVDAGQQWNVACYDDEDTPDDTAVYVGAPWVTDAAHRLVIFAPATAGQVGASQRHHGTWGTGYRRTHTLQLADRDVSIDGLAIQQSRALDGAGVNRALMVHTGHKGSDIRISNSYVEQARVSTGVGSHALFVADDDRPWGAFKTQVLVWNTIAVNQSSTGTTGTQGNGAIVNDTSDSLTIANCTAVSPNGASALLTQNDSGVVAPNLAVNTIAVTGGSNLTIAIFLFAPGFRSDHVTSDDGSVSSNTIVIDAGFNFANAQPAFVSPGDYHLLATDVAAHGRGMDLASRFMFLDDIDGQPRFGSTWDIGADQVFTPRLPEVHLNLPTFVQDTSAAFSGSAGPNGSLTTAWFRYGPGAIAACDDTFGERAPADGGFYIGQAGSLFPFGLSVTDLMPATQYSVCSVAENAAGVAFGELQTFSTHSPEGGGNGDAAEAPSFPAEEAVEASVGAAVMGGAGRASAGGWSAADAGTRVSACCWCCCRSARDDAWRGFHVSARNTPRRRAMTTRLSAG